MPYSIEELNLLLKSGNEDQLSEPDLSYLKEMSDGDNTFEKEMIEMFLNNEPPTKDLLIDAMKRDDLNDLRFIIHKLINQLNFVGIISVIPVLKIIERREEEMPDLNEMLTKIISIIDLGAEKLKLMIQQ